MLLLLLFFFQFLLFCVLLFLRRFFSVDFYLFAFDPIYFLRHNQQQHTKNHVLVIVSNFLSISLARYSSMRSFYGSAMAMVYHCEYLCKHQRSRFCERFTNRSQSPIKWKHIDSTKEQIQFENSFSANRVTTKKNAKTHPSFMYNEFQITKYFDGIYALLLWRICNNLCEMNASQPKL